ncbi:MAG: type II toxin-antitoxin system Phd/YefM family antitoxin [Actinomycetia bacterium]|nr:type II toxin-antitoxin system Phd/YefM family antitoxin [Actinomycetes bacterium]
MTGGVTQAIEVLPISAARTRLSAAADRFREDGIAAEPIVFGSHRKPEGVVIPFALFERLGDAIEDALLAELVRERLARDTGERVSFDQVCDDLGLDTAELAN